MHHIGNGSVIELLAVSFPCRCRHRKGIGARLAEVDDITVLGVGLSCCALQIPSVKGGGVGRHGILKRRLGITGYPGLQLYIIATGPVNVLALILCQIDQAVRVHRRYRKGIASGIVRVFLRLNGNGICPVAQLACYAFSGFIFYRDLIIILQAQGPLSPGGPVGNGADDLAYGCFRPHVLGCADADIGSEDFPFSILV